MPHTPGPWAVHDGGRFDQVGDTGPSICAEHEDNTCQPLFEFCGPASIEERKANGDLVAAAPVMLAALKFVQVGLLQMGSDWSDEANRIVAEAIAEAEGT